MRRKCPSFRHRTGCLHSLPLTITSIVCMRRTYRLGFPTVIAAIRLRLLEQMAGDRNTPIHLGGGVCGFTDVRPVHGITGADTSSAHRQLPGTESCLFVCRLFRASNDTAVLSKNIPVVSVMKHARSYGSSITEEVKTNLCLGSHHQAGDCSKRERDPSDGFNQTRGWSVGKYTWQNTYEDHTTRVSSAGSAFSWTSESEEDWIYPAGRP